MTESDGETQKPAQALHAVFLPYTQCKPAKTKNPQKQSDHIVTFNNKAHSICRFDQLSRAACPPYCTQV